MLRPSTLALSGWALAQLLLAACLAAPVSAQRQEVTASAVMLREAGATPDQDAVIAVPPYFGQTHRYALYDAADIAGLNILAEVSDISAAALQWGIDKEFTPQGKWTIIYDMGSTSVGAGLVRDDSSAIGGGSAPANSGKKKGKDNKQHIV